jgi:uncharacterized protein (DUF849 family)
VPAPVPGPGQPHGLPGRARRPERTLETWDFYLETTELDETAKAAIEAAEAGAAIVHLHARNPETGQPDPRPELFQKFMAQIKNGCDAVMNVSTGGGLGMSREERLRPAPPHPRWRRSTSGR